PVNCYYYTAATVSDTAATSKTVEAFENGEVAYLLNGSSSENVTWYQKLLTDTYPVLDSKHGIVYYGYADCRNMTYANTELSKDKPEHNWKCELDEANTNKMTFSCTTDGCTKGGTITVTAPEGAIYDGNNHTATVTVETEENEELIETPVITYDSLTEGVELVDGKPVNAGTYQAKVSFEGVLSYQEFEIKKAILDVTGVTATGRTYEKGNTSVAITVVALEGVADLDAVSVDVTGLKGTLSGANAGDYTEVTLPELKLSGADKDNYVLTQPSKAVPTNVTISPQAIGTAQNVTKKYLFSQENADTINLVSLLPKDCGTVVSYGTPAVDGNVIYKVTPSIEEGTLIYTVADGLAGNTGTITIDAKTQNYTSVPITISVALVDQIPVMQQTEVTLNDESQKLTYGQKLSVLELTEVVFKGTDGETVTGTLQWKNGDSIPTVDTKKASWEFVPSASYNDKYATVEGELTISVVPATPVVDTLPTVNAITYHPDTTLAGIALSGGKMNGIAGELTGTWAWKDATICPKAGDNTYVAVFTPEDSTNYKTKEMDITVSVAKATPYIKTAVAADAITYGATLKNSALSGGVVQYSETDETAVAGSWSWKEVTTKPVVADSNVTEYDVVFTPTDAENYNKVETKITLTVNKAETTPNMPESTMSALYSQKTVGALELPEGWVWNEAHSAKELTVDVAVEATAIYNGADKGNYVTESVTISITRQACDHEESDILYTGEGEKAPTCTVDGIGHTECTKCKEPMQTNVTVEASGHTGGTATCKNKAECSVCHEGYGELDKNNHAGETEVKDAKKATCAVDGYTGDTYCKDCGAKIATGTKIDKSTAHTWDNGVVTKEATATEKGEKTYTCSVCKITKKEEIPALGAPKVGEEIASEDGSATYKVTEAGENGNSVTYEAPTDKNQATVVVPATVTINNITYNVTTISDTAFAGNKKLTSVTIGDNVTGFSDKTFKGCSNLKTLIIGNGVTSVPANAFKNFKKLTTVKMGTGVKTIGKNAFYGCKKLKNLTIGKNVVTLGDKAFYKCTSLTKLTIPSKVKTIGKSTFEGCKALKTITIGKSVTKIGSKAFYGCSKTKTLTIKSSKLTTKKIGSKAFTKTPKSMTVKVPKKKFKAYKSMFIKRGVNKKAKFRKS
ncbi:MAG: leucine-rich repeat protein, partial [Lachnospiraceae bacterium]|nr:leucine-rich repeat protein [Lachnospiraceae bacterium]